MSIWTSIDLDDDTLNLPARMAQHHEYPPVDVDVATARTFGVEYVRLSLDVGGPTVAALLTIDEAHQLIDRLHRAVAEVSGE